MAKITYSASLGNYGSLSSFYSKFMLPDSYSTTEVVYKDMLGGEKITFDGVGLTVNGLGIINGGTITELHFTNKSGLSLIDAVDINITASAAASALTSKGVVGLLNLALGGSDTVTGSSVGDKLFGLGGADKINGLGGEDIIYGGKGNDRLNGGAAMDTFVFVAGDGKDTITGFDAVGGGHAQDYIEILKGRKYEIDDAGADTKITFSNGDTITLLNVDHTKVTGADFHFYL